MALVLDLLAQSGQPLSRLVAELPAVRDGEGPVPDPRRSAGGRRGPVGLWERIAAAFPEATPDRRDGLRLDWDDRWVHVRSSNTEPIVRVIAEAPAIDEARELSRQVGRWIGTA